MGDILIAISIVMTTVTALWTLEIITARKRYLSPHRKTKRLKKHWDEYFKEVKRRRKGERNGH